MIDSFSVPVVDKWQGYGIVSVILASDWCICLVLVNCCHARLIDILSCHRIVEEIGILLIQVWIRIGNVFVGLGWLTLVVVFVLFAKSDLCTIFLDNFLKPIVYLHNIVYNYTHLCIYTQTCVTSMTFNMFQIFDTRCRFTVCIFTHICVIFHQISFIFHLGYKILFHTIEFFTVSRWVAEIASWAME